MSVAGYARHPPLLLPPLPAIRASLLLLLLPPDPGLPVLKVCCR